MDKDGRLEKNEKHIFINHKTITVWVYLLLL